MLTRSLNSYFVPEVSLKNTKLFLFWNTSHSLYHYWFQWKVKYFWIFCTLKKFNVSFSECKNNTYSPRHLRKDKNNTRKIKTTHPTNQKYLLKILFYIFFQSSSCSFFLIIIYLHGHDHNVPILRCILFFLHFNISKMDLHLTEDMTRIVL